MRSYGSNLQGRSFDVGTVSLVWSKAASASGYDPNIVRQDSCGALIQRSAYGTTSVYGWEVDHILPVAKGGMDLLSNLQPLQWQNNRGKGDDYPKWYCTIK